MKPAIVRARSAGTTISEQIMTQQLVRLHPEHRFQRRVDEARRSIEMDDRHAGTRSRDRALQEALGGP